LFFVEFFYQNFFAKKITENFGTDEKIKLVKGLARWISVYIFIKFLIKLNFLEISIILDRRRRKKRKEKKENSKKFNENYLMYYLRRVEKDL
jgi:hypothetical protein